MANNQGATPNQVRDVYVKYFDRVPTPEEFQHHATKGTTLSQLTSWASTHPQAVKVSPTPTAPTVNVNVSPQPAQSKPQPSSTSSGTQTGATATSSTAAVAKPPANVTPESKFEFAGNDEMLIKFSDDPTPGDPSSDASTVWLFNKKDGTYTPFTSVQSLENKYQMPLSSLTQYINVLPTTALNVPSSPLIGTFLPASQGFDSTGYQLNPPPKVESTTSIAYGYNRPVDPVLNEAVGSWMGALFTTLKNSYNAISQTTFDKIFKDPTQLAKYTMAVANGGYSFGDVFKDAKAIELGLPANAVSATVPASEYYKTPEYIATANNSQLQLPINMSIDQSIFNLPLFQVPGAAFSTIIPPLDINSPQFKEEAKKIEADWYDLLLQQTEANTAQEKSIADDNWRRFKSDLERQYGWTLHDNINTAWGQYQNILDSGTTRGLLNSGITQEAIDKYLGDVKTSTDRLRAEKISEEDLKKRDYYINTATPEQIANDLTPEQRETWGLMPSQEVKNYVNQNPELKGILVDDNGYYRSKLYQTMYTNKYNYGQQKQTYQEGKLQEQKLREEEKAYAPYTRSNPFSSYNPSYAQPQLPSIPSTTSATSVSGVAAQSTTPNLGSITYNPAGTNPERAFSLPTAFHEQIKTPAEIANYTQVTKPGLNPNNPSALYGIPKSKKSTLSTMY